MLTCQFFVSGTAGFGVENQIANLLVEKILNAIRNKRVFRVFVVFPHPELIGHDNLPVLKFTYDTISRGKVWRNNTNL